MSKQERDAIANHLERLIRDARGCLVIEVKALEDFMWINKHKILEAIRFGE